MKKIAKIGLMLAAMTFARTAVFAQISIGVNISARIAPPALPVYTQPACPADGYLWTPGYWAYDAADGYYWVPGVWVKPPRTGVLWTPAYWGFEGGIYSFHTGYWGPHVGFYGGINYGFGYGGSGFYGGRWQAGAYRYNTAITNVNTTVIHNTYVNKTVINNNVVNNRTSFNGQGGVNAQPREEERQAMRENHIQPTSSQLAHQQSAGQDRSQFANVNQGRPVNAAMDRVHNHQFNQQNHNGMQNQNTENHNSMQDHNAVNNQQNHNVTPDRNAGHENADRMNANNNRQADFNNPAGNDRQVARRSAQQWHPNMYKQQHAAQPHNNQPHPHGNNHPHRSENERRS